MPNASKEAPVISPSSGMTATTRCPAAAWERATRRMYTAPPPREEDVT